MLKVSCPQCGTEQVLAPEDAGKQARCTHCETLFAVPELHPAPHLPPPTPAASLKMAGSAVGVLLAIGGLFLVLLTRGCDALGNRDVARANAMVEINQNAFRDKCEDGLAPMELQLADMERAKRKLESALRRDQSATDRSMDADEMRQRQREIEGKDIDLT
jgi:hypothetical protein